MTNQIKKNKERNSRKTGESTWRMKMGQKKERKSGKGKEEKE